LSFRWPTGEQGKGRGGGKDRGVLLAWWGDENVNISRQGIIFKLFLHCLPSQTMTNDMGNWGKTMGMGMGIEMRQGDEGPRPRKQKKPMSKKKMLTLTFGSN